MLDFSRMFQRKSNRLFKSCDRSEWLGVPQQSVRARYFVYQEGIVAEIVFYDPAGHMVSKIRSDATYSDRGFIFGFYGSSSSSSRSSNPNRNWGESSINGKARAKFFDRVIKTNPEIAEWMLWHWDEIEAKNV